MPSLLTSLTTPQGGWDSDREGARWDKVLADCRKRWDNQRVQRERNIKLYKDGAYPIHADGKSTGVSVNLIFLYAKSTQALLYGSDPVIQVDPLRGEQDRPFADASEGWLTHSHDAAETEDADGVNIFLAMLSGISWSKDHYDPETKLDVSDALSALEVAVDPFARYSMSQARWVVQLCTKPVDWARQFFNRQDIEPNYTLGETEGLEKDRLLTKESEAADKDLYQFFEIWAKGTDGKRDLLYRDPKKSRWIDTRDWPFTLDRNQFPYTPLIFNSQYQGIDGFSELDVVAGLRNSLQDLHEFDRRHTLRAAAKKIILDGSVWTEELTARMTDAKDLEPLILAGLSGRSIRDTYTILDVNSSTDLQAEKAERAKQMHDELLGFGELQRGVAMRQKTATESEIQDEWTKSRSQYSLRCIDKWKRQQLRHRIQIARQLVSAEEVTEAVGPEAGIAWAQYAGGSTDLMRSFRISIKAGSTGEHAKRKNVEEAQRNLELAMQINDSLIAQGQPPVYDIVELSLEVSRAREVRNPERFLLAPPTTPQMGPGLQQLGQMPPEMQGEQMPQGMPPNGIPPQMDPQLAQMMANQGLQGIGTQVMQ